MAKLSLNERFECRDRSSKTCGINEAVMASQEILPPYKEFIPRIISLYDFFTRNTSTFV